MRIPVYLVGCILFLPVAAAVFPADAASSDTTLAGRIGGGVLPPVKSPAPTPPPGWINPGGPMLPGPGKVHCDCVRLVGDHSVPCCP